MPRTKTRVSAADKRRAELLARAERRRHDVATALDQSQEVLAKAAAFTRKYDGITVERAESQSFATHLGRRPLRRQGRSWMVLWAVACTIMACSGDDSGQPPPVDAEKAIARTKALNAACEAAAAAYLNVEYDAFGWGTPVPSTAPDGYRFVLGDRQVLSEAPRDEDLASCVYYEMEEMYPAVVVVRVTGETVVVAVGP